MVMSQWMPAWPLTIAPFAPRAGLFRKILVHSPHLINSPLFTEVIDIVCVIACVPFLSTALDRESLAVATTPGT